jgi:hypothetical protein
MKEEFGLYSNKSYNIHHIHVYVLTVFNENFTSIGGFVMLCTPTPLTDTDIMTLVTD